MITLLIVLFLFSAYFSGMETGFLSLDKFELEKRSKSSKKSKQIFNFTQKMDRVLTTILIGNSLSNVALASLFTYQISKSNFFPVEVGTFFLVAVMVIFAECLPKIFYKEHAMIMVNISFKIFLFFYRIFYPLVFLIAKLNIFIIWIFGLQKSETKIDTSELSNFLRESDSKNINLIQEALEFSILEAKKVMTPRTEIIGFEQEEDIEQVLRIAKQKGYTKFPIYEKNIDNIVGILILYDLLDVKKKPLRDVMRKVFFAPENIEINKLLRQMQERKSLFCVLIDAYGGTSGIVTIEDIMEELVGDIEDEYDLPENAYVKKIKPKTYLIRASVEIANLRGNFKINLQESQEYNTLAGFIIWELEKIPKRGFTFKVDKYTIKIEKSTNKKIELIRLSYE